MITLLDSIGPAIWRASWQAVALALVVMLLLRGFGDRMSPRWRFLLWSVVLTRFLFVATPGSPWSAFNIVHWTPAANTWPIAQPEIAKSLTVAPQRSASIFNPTERDVAAPRVAGSRTEAAFEQPIPSAEAPIPVAEAATNWQLSIRDRFDANFVTRILSLIWLAGCLALALKLLTSVFVLRRRLSACRPVTDAGVLDLLDSARRRIGLKRSPLLFVTPECFSPCIVGTWRPRIVLPESIVTEANKRRLRHVLAHELAHLVRGDLWTNWLLLAARILHWFNPVAWWTVRAMQSEREAACDELAFAALGEVDRSAYAATIVELAASLSPSAIAPGLIGLFSSTDRLKARIERLVRFPSVSTLRAPIAAGLILSTALLGLTDSMPGAEAQAPAKVAGREAPSTDASTVDGKCVDYATNAPAAGVSVRLYKIEGRTSAPVEIARTVTNANGSFSFTGLLPPDPRGHLDYLKYGVFGFGTDGGIGTGSIHFQEDRAAVTIRMTRDKSTLSGKVIDSAGRAVAGATVVQQFVDGRPVIGLSSTTTDSKGQFKLDKVPVYRSRNDNIESVSLRFAVIHADYPVASGEANQLAGGGEGHHALRVRCHGYRDRQRYRKTRPWSRHHSQAQR